MSMYHDPITPDPTAFDPNGRSLHDGWKAGTLFTIRNLTRNGPYHACYPAALSPRGAVHAAVVNKYADSGDIVEVCRELPGSRIGCTISELVLTARVELV